jgi:hypothetical protein
VQVVRDSRRKWRDAHPDYQKQYWQSHPKAAEQNRQRQRQRDRKRRVQSLVKNNSAFDLKRSVAEVWPVGPAAPDLEKNNLASCQFLTSHPESRRATFEAAKMGADLLVAEWEVDQKLKPPVTE